MAILLLDGPMGTALEARGVPTPLPGWSSHALETAPDVVRAIHAEYAASGARVHTTNTFRTRPAVFPERWEELARLAVRLAREAVPAEHRVAGCVAPIEDCYRPDLSPAERDPGATRREHAALAGVLADEGCDLLLCETFPHALEGRLAVEAAVATGLETWSAFTPGPNVDLFTPESLAEAAVRAVEAGASAAFVNCVPAPRALPFVEALRAALPAAVPVGVYGNTGFVDDATGWRTEPIDAEEYADLAEGWVAAGASVLAGCCGTGAAHLAALARRFGRR